MAGCVATGYGEALGTELFDIIEPFADYAFNKSHSYGYGFIAYQTAWLKAHHPVEYLASLLTSVKDNKDKTAVYLGECRSLGHRGPGARRQPVAGRIRRRLLWRRGADRRPREAASGAITFGLAAVRNVGEGLVGHIVAERERNGPFIDFYDFCQRVDPQVLNKRTIESLIKAGGFDSLGHPRQGLCLVFEEIVDRTLERRREHDAGVVSLFAALEPEADGGHRLRRHPGPHPRHRVRQVPAAGLREGDARPLHQRPSTDGAWKDPSPVCPTAPWPTCATDPDPELGGGGRPAG